MEALPELPQHKLDGRTHVLTVSVEDYFHVAAFRDAVCRKHFDRFESRLERNVDATLEMLQSCGATATFFVLGWVAERQPGIVRKIIAAGHEIAASP
ncbi:MAG: polysaccharide deacetylase family protein [Acidobacteria bacterium]|jgi:peptidoglycan/xylan/chitin deacetylase (PgdA/CDA1 family)|nr:polysaccharide deacetylase family protein [Acidobacteriota bacterium]